MEKRIIIRHHDSLWIIAINTKQGTLREFTFLTNNHYYAQAVLDGYLKMFEDSIEIHPLSNDAYLELLTIVGNSWYTDYSSKGI